MTATEFAAGGDFALDEHSFDVREVELPQDTDVYATDYPIPLEHRLYYIENEELPDFYPSADEIAEMIGADTEWVEHTAGELGIEELGVGGYPEYTVPVLRQEWEWQQAYNASNEFVSLEQIQATTEMANSWVSETLRELGYEPFRVVKVRGSVTKCQYVKPVMQHLRAVKMSVRPAGEWVTRYELTEVSGWTWQTVDRFLRNNTFDPQERRSKTGREVPHYPPESKTAMMTEMEIAEGKWYTKAELCELLGQPGCYDWLDKRLLPYEATQRMLRDNLNKLLPHYPEWVFLRIRADSAKERMGLEHMHEGHISINSLAVLAGRGVDTVRKILRYLGEPIVMRINERDEVLPTCDIELLHRVATFDTILLADKVALAKSVSERRAVVRSFEEQLAVKKAAMAEGRDASSEVLRADYEKTRYELRKARMRLGSAACNYDTYKNAESAFRAQ